MPAFPYPDPATYWLDVLLECNRLDHGLATPDQAGPTKTSRAFAIVLSAIADTVRLATNNPALTATVGLPAPANQGSLDAAVHGAASLTICTLYPQHAAILRAAAPPVPSPDPASFAFGELVAKRHLAVRANDGSTGKANYGYSGAYGRHQADPLAPGQTALDAHWGNVTPFVANAVPSLPHPPGLSAGTLDPTDAAYLAALTDVRTHGRSDTYLSNPHDAMVGIYWGYDGSKGLGTPPRLYLQIVRSIADQRGFNATKGRADLFALVALAMADAGIQAWKNKYLYDLWRPVAGIRRHHETPALSAASPLVGDPFWKPLGLPNTNSNKPNLTPGFPAYPSGHATFGAASLHVARLVLAKLGVSDAKLGEHDLTDCLAFDFVSDEFNGENSGEDGVVRPHISRHFESLWDAILENGRSRVFLGVHWQFDSHEIDAAGKPTFSAGDVASANPKLPIGGVPLGLRIANDVWSTLSSKIL